MRPRRGMSLAETILTVALIGLVFGLATNLISKGYEVLRFTELKENSLLVAQVGLDRMTSESREAVEILDPGPGSSSPELTLRKINPTTQGVRFNPPAGNWDPLAGSMQIRYFTDGEGKLNRDAGGSIEVLCRGIYGLTCERLDDGNLDLRVAVFESHAVRTISTRVYLPCAP